MNILTIIIFFLKSRSVPDVGDHPWNHYFVDSALNNTILSIATVFWGFISMIFISYPSPFFVRFSITQLLKYVIFIYFAFCKMQIRYWRILALTVFSIIFSLLSYGKFQHLWFIIRDSEHSTIQTHLKYLWFSNQVQP